MVVNAANAPPVTENNSATTCVICAVGCGCERRSKMADLANEGE